eukprot:CAMPEP_0178677874 /NCGR_PEP_ID=MMETSP0698-20121128/36671_1 /TAXON_ID=265572 /ORGANISM="Extubocellulus spinifer, Strain CCMP396" /LENGTH=673 /DNA_ID=CAMNT_0020322187 /DNA_START=106 /DNA_END=2123 /DNA_ORIENTATION=-
MTNEKDEIPNDDVVVVVSPAVAEDAEAGPADIADTKDSGKNGYRSTGESSKDITTSTKSSARLSSSGPEAAVRVEVHHTEDRRPISRPTSTSPTTSSSSTSRPTTTSSTDESERPREKSDKARSIEEGAAAGVPVIVRPDDERGDNETAPITSPDAHDDDNIEATADRFQTALPAAYAVDEYDLPVAYDITDGDDTEMDMKKKQGSKKKCGVAVLVLLAVIAIILIAVGTATGFTSAQSANSKSIEDDDELGQSSEESEKSKSSSSEDDLPPPSCPAFVPLREYTPPSEARRYCKEGKCWEQVGPTMLGLLHEKFGNHLKFNSAGDRLALSSSRAGSCNGGDIGIIRVYDMNASYDFNQIGQTIEGFEEGDYARGVLSGDGRRLAVGYPKHNSYDLNNAGAFLVYELDETSGNWTALGNPLYYTAKKSRFGGHFVYVSIRRMNSTDGVRWEQMGQPLALPINETATRPKFGYKVKLSADGRTIVIGRKNEDEIDAGGVVAFRYVEEEDIWAQLGDEIMGLSERDAFGRHLDASFGSGTVRVAAGGKDEYLETNSTSTGYIRVFELDERNKTWTQMGGPIIGEIPGTKLNIVSLSANGTRLAAGTARGPEGGNGRGYFLIYDYIDGEWRQVGGKVESAQSAEYGLSLNLSPDGSLLFSTRPEPTHGAVRIYKLV